MSKFLITSFAIDKLYSRGSEIWTNLVGKKLLNKETNKKNNNFYCAIIKETRQGKTCLVV